VGTSLFGSRAAAALAAAQRELAESRENGAAVYEVVQALGRASSVMEATQAALDAIRQAFGWASAAR
jgi:hypothetical protein